MFAKGRQCEATGWVTANKLFFFYGYTQPHPLAQFNEFETKRSERLAPFIFYEFMSFSSDVCLTNTPIMSLINQHASVLSSPPAPTHTACRRVVEIHIPLTYASTSNGTVRVRACVWVACSHIAYYKVTTLRRRVMDSRYEIMLSWYPLGRRICSPRNLCAPGTALFVFRVSAGRESSSCELSTGVFCFCWQENTASLKS